MMRIRVPLVYGVLAAALALMACGASSEETDPSAEGRPAEAAEVTIEAFDFQPGELTVSVGDTVTWENQDDILHTVTSGVGQEQGVPGVSENTEAEPDGLFDKQLEGIGETYTFTFEETGTFPYYCSIHPGMNATIVVE